jgi:YD repeat-containing protein
MGGLARYNHSGSNDYDYDPIGNITSLAGSSPYNYVNWHNNCGSNTPTQPLPHAVKQIGSDYYCYDNNGNMTQRAEGGVIYTQSFDVENRLTQVTASGSSQVTQFAYDASGQRLRTSVHTSGVSRTITTYPFPQYEVELRQSWQPCSGSCGDDEGSWVTTDTIIRRTYLLGGQAIATRITGDPVSGNNGLFYLHTDHLGSTSMLTTSYNDPQKLDNNLRWQVV